MLSISIHGGWSANGDLSSVTRRLTMLIGQITPMFEMVSPAIGEVSWDIQTLTLPYMNYALGTWARTWDRSDR